MKMLPASLLFTSISRDLGYGVASFKKPEICVLLWLLQSNNIGTLEILLRQKEMAPGGRKKSYERKMSLVSLDINILTIFVSQLSPLGSSNC